MSSPNPQPEKTPEVTQSPDQRAACASAAELRRTQSSSFSSLDEPVEDTPPKKHTRTFIRDLNESYGSPDQLRPEVTEKPVPNDTPPSATSENEVQWISQTRKRKQLEKSVPLGTRRSRRKACKIEQEKKEKKVKVGALVRKNLTQYGVGGDKSIVVHDVPTLGLVKRLRNSTRRFLVEFDNDMTLELRYSDFTYLTNTPEKQILGRDANGNMAMTTSRQAVMDNEVTFLGVTDSPIFKNRVRRDYGVDIEEKPSGTR
jgi:hypothetical protein